MARVWLILCCVIDFVSGMVAFACFWIGLFGVCGCVTAGVLCLGYVGCIARFYLR